MALVALRQVLDHAAENGYAVPAFNVNNLEQVQAIMEAAELTIHLLFYKLLQVRENMQENIFCAI